MTYGLSTTLDRPFDDTVTAVRRPSPASSASSARSTCRPPCAPSSASRPTPTSSSGPATPPTPTARCRPIRRSVCCCQRGHPPREHRHRRRDDQPADARRRHRQPRHAAHRPGGQRQARRRHAHAEQHRLTRAPQAPKLSVPTALPRSPDLWCAGRPGRPRCRRREPWEVLMNPDDILTRVGDQLGIRRVFGEPIGRDRSRWSRLLSPSVAAVKAPARTSREAVAASAVWCAASVSTQSATGRSGSCPPSTPPRLPGWASSSLPWWCARGGGPGHDFPWRPHARPAHLAGRGPFR